MDKSVNFRLDSGTFMVVEANAKKNRQTVSEWLRKAVDEQIKRSANSRMLDRIDERVYQLTKDATAIMNALEKVQQAIDELEVIEE